MTPAAGPRRAGASAVVVRRQLFVTVIVVPVELTVVATCWTIGQSQVSVSKRWVWPLPNFTRGPPSVPSVVAHISSSAETPWATVMAGFSMARSPGASVSSWRTLPWMRPKNVTVLVELGSVAVDDGVHGRRGGVVGRAEVERVRPGEVNRAAGRAGGRAAARARRGGRRSGDGPGRDLRRHELARPAPRGGERDEHRRGDSDEDDRQRGPRARHHRRLVGSVTADPDPLQTDRGSAPLQITRKSHLPGTFGRLGVGSQKSASGNRNVVWPSPRP